MIDHRTPTAAPLTAARQSLPVPMSAACMRALLHTVAGDRVYADRARKSGQSQSSRMYKPRTDRLTRVALRAEARAADLLAEVR